MGSLTIGYGLIRDETTWTVLKKLVDECGLPLRFSETDAEYVLYSPDDSVVHTVVIFRGAVPPTADRDQATNDGWKDDFETNYKAEVVRAIRGCQRDGSQKVAVVGSEGMEYIGCTHDFCDKTTWWQNSQRVSDEVLVDSGDGLTFASAHTGWIDLYHGNVYEELSVRGSAPHAFAVSVEVDGVPQIERKAFAPSGGDYETDHTTGRITFFVSQTGKTVSASYSYATDNEWSLTGAEGMVLELRYAEIQFAQDLQLLGGIVMDYWLGDTVAAQVRYDSVKQVIYESRGNYPIIKSFGGATRGVHQDIQVFPMTYMGVKRIFFDPAKAAANNGCTKITARLVDHDDQPVECVGELATATFYGLWRFEHECCRT